MLVAEIDFGHRRSCSIEDADALDIAEGYHAALFKNGQVGYEYVIGWSKGSLKATVYVPRPDSLAQKHLSKWGQSELKRLKEIFGTSPKWQVVDDRKNISFAKLSDEKALYLFTLAFDKEPAVCAGSNGSPIPAYLLPVTYSLKEEIHHWARSYIEIDSVCLGCGELEIACYKQLASPDSELSKQGRELSREIEDATGLPTYYYLTRYWGRRGREHKRFCPVCGGPWFRRVLSEKNKEERWGLDWFDFLCKKCRLVSHIASSFEDERHARIGEYSRKQKKKTRKSPRRKAKK